MTAKYKPQPTGMILVASYIVLFFTNSFVILVGNHLFPQHIVLGTAHITKTWSLIHSIGTFSLLSTFIIPFVHDVENKRRKMYSPSEWMKLFFVTNFIGIWLVTRFATQLGFGISSWFVALLLAAILDIFQGIAMMQLEKWNQELA